MKSDFEMLNNSSINQTKWGSIFVKRSIYIFILLLPIYFNIYLCTIVFAAPGQDINLSKYKVNDNTQRQTYTNDYSDMNNCGDLMLQIEELRNELVQYINNS
jgi:hypothetical protein